MIEDVKAPLNLQEVRKLACSLQEARRPLDLQEVRMLWIGMFDQAFSLQEKSKFRELLRRDFFDGVVKLISGKSVRSAYTQLSYLQCLDNDIPTYLKLFVGRNPKDLIVVSIMVSGFPIAMDVGAYLTALGGSYSLAFLGCPGGWNSYRNIFSDGTSMKIGKIYLTGIDRLLLSSGDKSVLVVDDVFGAGKTVKRVNRMLVKMGFRDVHYLIDFDALGRATSFKPFSIREPTLFGKIYSRLFKKNSAVYVSSS